MGTYPSGPRPRSSGMPAPTETDAELPDHVRSSWQRFIDTYEPLRAPLFRYCRYLTRSPWDAEDLTQDTLARAFVTLGKMGGPPANPRAWLLRVASNLWIDRVRRPQLELQPSAEASSTPHDPQASREAAGTLLVQLSPQERAAVVLKDVFELALDEIAEVLSTTTGAVKAALHRGRGKLVEAEPASERTPAPGVLDSFCAAFNAGDLDGLTALLLDTAAVEVVGATVQYGREDARRTVLYGMLFGAERLAASADHPGVQPTRPRCEPRSLRGRWVVLHWYQHDDGEAVRAITELVADGEHVATVRNYFYSPELVADVCEELGLPHRSNGHRWWPFGCTLG
jgi:RNA polymerase sigma-70 factor, ECF subfamily